MTPAERRYMTGAANDLARELGYPSLDEMIVSLYQSLEERRQARTTHDRRQEEFASVRAQVVTHSPRRNLDIEPQHQTTGI